MSLHHKTWLSKSRATCFYEPKENTNGFTLIELLIALAILAVLLTLVTTTFGSALRTMNTFETRSQIFHSSRVAFSMLNDELQSTVVSTASQKPHFVGTPSTIQARFFDRISFDSYRFQRFPDSSAGTDPVMFDWWVEEGTLFQREIPRLFGILKPLDSPIRPRPDAPLDFASGVFPLSHAVKTFRLRYYHDTQWVNQWSSRDKDMLPDAISIELTLRLSENDDQKFSTFIRLPRGHQKAF